MTKKFAIPGEHIKELVAPMGACLMTDRIAIDGLKIGYMYREEPDFPEDSGWRFFAGDESEDYLDDPKHTDIYAVNTAANYDQDIIPYLDKPPLCAFEKVSNSHEYRRVEDPG